MKQDEIFETDNLKSKDEENNFQNENLDSKNEDSPDPLSLELEKARAEVADVWDKFKRASADFENIKKRMQRDQLRLVDFANESFAKDLLAILDALEKVEELDTTENELATSIKEGVDNCIKIFLDVFKKHDIKIISTDEPFNPEVHEALSMIESDKQSGSIVGVYQKGYMYKDRVLRPSKVVIAK